jgi:hypothetical protein
MLALLCGGLYQLFQMTVVKPASAAPSITIAK